MLYMMNITRSTHLYSKHRQRLVSHYNYTLHNTVPMFGVG